MAGAVLIIIGVVLLAGQLGVMLPPWVISWEMLLVSVGIYIGAKHNFRNPAWLIPTLIGGVFLIDDFYPEVKIGSMLWPALIIATGLFMIFKPKRHHGPWKQWKNNCRLGVEEATGTEDTIESTSVFGGVKKNIMSKEFKGGEVVCFFGGCELNLTQADIQGNVVLEITQVFGGTKLIVPPHWDIKSEMTVVLGDIEDRRLANKETAVDPEKVLLLKGSTVLGGIDIRSF